MKKLILLASMGLILNAQAVLDPDINGFTVLDGPESFQYHFTTDFCKAHELIHNQLFIQVNRELKHRPRQRELRRQTRILNRNGRRLNNLIRRYLSRHQEQIQSAQAIEDPALRQRHLNFLQLELQEYLSDHDVRQNRYQEETRFFQNGQPICPRGYRLDQDRVNCNGPGGGATPFINVLEFQFQSDSGSGEITVRINNCMNRYEGMNRDDAYYTAEIKKLCQQFQVSSDRNSYRISRSEDAINLALDQQLSEFSNQEFLSAADQRINRPGRWSWLLRGRQLLRANPNLSFFEFYEQLGNPEHVRTCTESINETARNSESSSSHDRADLSRSSSQNVQTDSV